MVDTGWRLNWGFSMLCGLFLSMLSFAHADEGGDVEPEHIDLREGWVEQWEGNPMAARAVAGRALSADSGDLQAHYLYIQAGTFEESYLENMYREWLGAEPEDPVRKTALAMVLWWTNDEAGEWCTEADELLAEQGSTPDLQYWGHRVRFLVHRQCEVAASDDVIGVLAVADASSFAQYTALSMRIQTGQINGALVADLMEMTTADPWMLNAARRLWFQSTDDGRMTRRARRAVLAVARTQAESDVLLHQYAAWRVLDIADDPMATSVRTALDVAFGDPPATPTEGSVSAEGSVSVNDVYDANRVPLPALALEGLQALEADLGEQGAARLAYERLMGERLAQMERHEEAVGHYKAAWTLNPTPRNANAYAWSATEAKQDMDAALDAMDQAIAEIATQTVSEMRRWQTEAEWTESAQYTRANFFDTRGWLLYQMGDHEAALRDLQTSVLLYSDETFHVHLAHVLVDMDNPLAAFENLVQAALASDGGLGSDARQLLEQLYVTAGGWHPNGLDGYLTARQRSVPAEEGDEPEVHPLMGSAFPFTEYTDLNGRTQSLQTDGDILVVDFWATWCGPCIQGMPHLQEVAQHYAEQGVRVLGLSVDEKVAEARAFFDHDIAIDYTVGWVGEGGFETGQFNGIPSLFVLDREGNIHAYIKGYSRGDQRLEQALDALLETPAQ